MLEPRTFAAAALGAKPMNLGLDLRGGVHFLLEVDLNDINVKARERYLNDLPALLRRENIRYTGRREVGDAVVLEFDSAERQAAMQAAAMLFARCNLLIISLQSVHTWSKSSHSRANQGTAAAVRSNAVRT